MMLNRYCSSKEELDKLFEYIPGKAYIPVHYIHNIEHREKWWLPNRRIDEYILAYVREGDGYYIIQDTKIDFKKGSVILIAPNTPFSAQSGIHTPFLYSVRFSFFDHINNSKLSLHKKSLFIHYNGESSYNDIFEQLYSNYIMRTNNDIKLSLTNANMTQILCHLWQDFSQATLSINMKINKAKVYIEKHPLRKHTITELAQISGFSESYFSKKFKGAFGESPKSYIFHIKMKYAKELILQYNYTVKEVAYLLDYSDPYIFSNQFKKFFGVSPSHINYIR